MKILWFKLEGLCYNKMRNISHEDKICVDIKMLMKGRKVHDYTIN